MTTSLLVVTVDAPFGELMRQSLEETGNYRILIARNVEDALAVVKKEKPPLVFLDTTYNTEDALQAGRTLRGIDAKVQFIVISDSGWHSALEELTPHGYLPKPFYLPDLLELLTRFFALNTPPEPSPTKLIEHRDEPRLSPSDNVDLHWLEDVNRAAQHLTRLTLESSAQAALITRNDKLWSYAGQFPQAAARELVDTLAHYWDREGGSDLLRFIRLSTTEAEHMLYATQLASGMVLALIFDAETSFTTIRSQASNLVRSLSVLPAEEAPFEGADDDDADIDVTPLADILGIVPSPKPQQDARLTPALYSPESAPVQPLANLQTPHFSHETSPALRLETAIDTDQIQEGTELESEFETPPDWQLETRKNAAQRKKADNLADTRPRSVTDVARRIVVEPASPAVYNLTYACLLIPRFVHHYMTGDLRDKLSEWIPQISVAYGWRLEHILIRPDYIQWNLNVPPATSPGYLMRVFRQQLSDKIFADFPRLKAENPSGDFWAPGYLIMGGSQPPPDRLIREFIEQTRARQGLS
jgi:CheY-like chemotaxis protein/REP element-mobilizing transposase RayT